MHCFGDDVKRIETLETELNLQTNRTINLYGSLRACGDRQTLISVGCRDNKYMLD